MAMRGRGVGIGGYGRPQAPMRTLSQTFKPKSEWKDEPNTAILLLYLPGFVREQIRVMSYAIEEAIQVEAERRLPNNRLIRVNETFTVPADCDVTKLETNFARGILMLKMPKKEEPPPSTPTPTLNPAPIPTPAPGAPTASSTPNPTPTLTPTATPTLAVPHHDNDKTTSPPSQKTLLSTETKVLPPEKNDPPIQDHDQSPKTDDIIMRKLAGDEEKKEMEPREMEHAMLILSPREKRQLLVNTGVAALLILGFTASLYNSLA